MKSLFTDRYIALGNEAANYITEQLKKNPVISLMDEVTEDNWNDCTLVYYTDAEGHRDVYAVEAISLNSEGKPQVVCMNDWLLNKETHELNSLSYDVIIFLAEALYTKVTNK
ncbi:MAG TPA: hypothetical protein VK705_10110 [Ferruginibacter sp.]|nr:hypothetical protein [Ferruginibacter sp.]